MLIKALRVEGVGRFAAPVHVDGFGPGVNVLAAGNEVGKSTLFRSIRTCLFARHDSKAQEIRELGSDDSQLPATIELTFEHAGHTYLIKKSFLRSPSASLSKDGREIARYKQADEAVWDLLGIQPGSGRNLDDGAFGLLWVGQGASFAVPTPGAGASTLLNSVIESEVGALVGGERARQLLAEVHGELSRSLTETERPRADGPLQRALQDLETWTSTEREARSKLDAVEQQLTELAKCRRRYAELTDPAIATRMNEELVEANGSLTEARTVHQEIRRLEAEDTSARRGVESSTQRLKQFRDICARVDANRSRASSLSAELPDLLAREHEFRSSLTRTQEEVAVANAFLQGLAAKQQQLDKLSGMIIRAQRKDELARQIVGLEEIERDLIDAEAQLANIKVKPKSVDELDTLEREIATLDAQASAAAAQLAIEVLPAGAGQVRLGENALIAKHSGPVLAAAEILVSDLARITVTPAAHAADDIRKSVADKRETILRSLGVSDAADAHAHLSRRREIEAARKGILAQLKSLGVDGELAAAISKLKVTLAQNETAIVATLAESQRSGLPTAKEVEEESLSIARDRTSYEGLRARLEARRREEQNSLEAALEQRSAKESRLEQVRLTVTEDLAICPDDERSARDRVLVAEVLSCDTAMQTASTALAVARESAPDAAEIQRRETRCERLIQALENQKKELLQLERDTGQLTGRIQSAGGDGVGEALAVAKEQTALAEREVSRARERIAVLQLLRDTVSNSLSEGRERYFEPIRRHLRPFLNDLFPGAELELGEGFAVTGINRGRAEAFRRLSDGTQEQIAVLVRLAMGAMLAERGQNVPVILDDALVYCDDDRIQRMFDALSRAGKQQQIIVLTCRLRTFSALGGHALRVNVASEGGSSIAA